MFSSTLSKLKKNDTDITELDCSSRKLFGDKNFFQKDIAAINEALISNTIVKKWKLGDVRARLGQNANFGKMLGKNKSLKKLDLARICFTEDGFVAFCEGLKNNITLQKLNLSSLNISKLDEDEFVSDEVTAKFSLENMKSLCNALQKTGIKKLDLSSLQLDLASVQVLCQFLVANKTIEIIDLQNSQLDDQAAKCLIELLEKNNVLKGIHLDDNKISSEKQKNIESILKKRKTLEVKQEQNQQKPAEKNWFDGWRQFPMPPVNLNLPQKIQLQPNDDWKKSFQQLSLPKNLPVNPDWVKNVQKFPQGNVPIQAQPLPNPDWMKEWQVIHFNNEAPKKTFTKEEQEIVGKVPLLENLIIPSGKLFYGDKVAEGGFGEVYKGTYNNLIVAIKRSKTKTNSLSEDEKNIFVREMKTMARLDHPNIIKVFGLRVKADGFAIAMEWAGKGTLSGELLKQYLTSAQKYVYVEHIVNGLDYLHALSIVHGDLKSPNILIDENNIAKISDFGLSTVKTESRKTFAHTQWGGTLFFCAPEIFNHTSENQHTTAIDIYAFAMVLYEMLMNGKQPFYEINFQMVNINLFLSNEVCKKNKRPTIPPTTNNFTKKLLEDCWAPNLFSRPNAKQILHNLKKGSWNTPFFKENFFKY